MPVSLPVCRAGHGRIRALRVSVRSGPVTRDRICAGMVTVLVCEALLLALTNAGILAETEIAGARTGAAAPHANVIGFEAAGNRHRAIAALTRQIIPDGYSVRTA